MDTVYKILENVEVKKVGERQYEFTASTADVDREGEAIDVTGWDLKNFKKNPVIMYGHDYRSLPIGKATKIGVRNGKLMNTVEFPPEGTYEFADIVERLVNTGYLKTESVGFIPKTWEDGEDAKSPRRTYTKQELLEISIVPVPSNPNALMNAVEEGVITTKQLATITKKEKPEVVEPEEETELEEIEHPQEKEISQGEIADQIDYTKELIHEGVSTEVLSVAWELVREILRLSGDDIPVDIKELVSPVVEIEETSETITYLEIQEAIKRIANNMEESKC
jgi:HK97 family phage prohead protease